MGQKNYHPFKAAISRVAKDGAGPAKREPAAGAEKPCGGQEGGEDQMTALQLPGDEGPLDALTSKQRAVLDLLIQHKTSKEISRLLGISPHTVDQRIMLARAKLQVATRGEVAQAYRRLLDEQRIPAPNGIYERSVYGSSHVEVPGSAMHSPDREDEVPVRQPNKLFRSLPSQAAAVGPDGTTEYYHVLPEIFDGPNGTLLRLGAIAVITVFLILIILGGLTIFSQLSEILGH
ncbi:helix-turn-helix transcriptional regulator [Novosphingobium sp. KCTC 2891]|uniref:helix-turn-helix transcriptional regulator n=1 Tax=Novosphingobium sp. KCTC 2891 TaxID=2989730 RepID=UPI00222169BD|nr:helix-turn-helix transcriptional regulator [Novosphingobium sp. KCTC 2891]MCW1381315.1 helix-turn-helix transcriptional regulator [Novosphingobium sp. KCTC 2891]